MKRLSPLLLLLLVGCPKHHETVATWPGPDGRSCWGKRVVVVEPDPWTPLTSVALRLADDSAPAVGTARRPLAVLHPDDLAKGFRLDLQGALGASDCRVDPSDPDVEQLQCGTYHLSVHYAPLCEYPAEIEGLERKGRPEIANFVLAQRFGERFAEPDVRDAWNAMDPWDLAARTEACDPATASCRELRAIRTQMNRGLARLDGLDRFDDPKDARDREALGAGLDWCDAETTSEGPMCAGDHPLRDLLLDDAVLVDTTKRCAADASTFLEIELAHLQGRRANADGERHQTCGGRTPGDDVIDAFLTLTINGLDRVPPGAPFYGPSQPDHPARGDGVDGPSEPATDEFPFLAEPRREP
jgi:hypothetical protein